MSERNDSDFPSDMLEAAERIPSYTAKFDYDSFALDTKTQDAVIRRLIHDYFGVNIDIIWEVISNELRGVADSPKETAGE
jgi:uncharacterized protein with HEPN domain